MWRNANPNFIQKCRGYIKRGVVPISDPWMGYGYRLGSLEQVAFLPSTVATGFAAAVAANLSGTGSGSGQSYPQLVSCLAPNADCQAHGWTAGTGGPREWIYNGLKALKVLLATPCDPHSTNSTVEQACNLDNYVFTGTLSGSRAKFLEYLGQNGFPSFYDGTTSTLPRCGWVADCDNSTEVRDDFVGQQPTIGDTIIFDKILKPGVIPQMRTFYHPVWIYRELLGMVGQHDADNMALVFHEALHAYTRLPDFPNFFIDPNQPSLKGVLGCNKNWTGTYDITAFLMQFTNPIPEQNIDPCSGFSGRVPPSVPPQ
jgi:hypothetical protein